MEFPCQRTAGFTGEMPDGAAPVCICVCMHMLMCVREEQMHVVVVGSYSQGEFGETTELSMAPDQWCTWGYCGVSSLANEALMERDGPEGRAFLE